MKKCQFVRKARKESKIKQSQYKYYVSLEICVTMVTKKILNF